jgi:phosphate transport system substrate-binding protein
MNKKLRIVVASIAVLGSLMLIACGQQETEAEAADGKLRIQGAGATFPAPLYQKWAEVYAQDHPDVSISYDSVGSGEGIKRFIAESVDFGASDAAMRDSEIAQVKRGVQLIPATAGMVVLAYNIPGVTGDLKLSREVYTDIFRGEIRTWNDPRIKAANPELDLPNLNIVIVARKDSSGTTYVMTNHLSAIDEEWRDRGPGTGKLIDWPGETMVASGNEGVAQRIKISEGAIGYVEYGFAKRLGLPMALLENKAGRFVKPNASSGQVALKGGSQDLPDHLRFFIPDPDGASSYPIVGYSWLLLYDQYPDAAKAAVLKDSVKWSLTEGQKYGEELGYIPLPEEVATTALAVVDRIR